METQAKQEFAQAQGVYSQEVAKLNALLERKKEYENKARELLCGTLKVLEIEENKAALIAMDGYISLQRLEVQRAEQNVEKAREHMAEAMREKKTYETLREQAFEEFLKEENRAEGKTVDELVSYTYGQKRQVSK